MKRTQDTSPAPPWSLSRGTILDKAVDKAMHTGDPAGGYGDPFSAYTVRALFQGGCHTFHASREHYVQDHHPEPLRMWRDFGMSCPDGWYAVSVRMGADDRFRPLWIRVEMDPVKPPVSGPGSGQAHGAIQLRTVWFTSSPEYAGEVARQLREGDRCAFHPEVLHPGTNTGNPVPGPVSVRLSSGKLLAYPFTHHKHYAHESTPATVRVYRREGDRPVLLSEHTASFEWPTWDYRRRGR